MTLSRRSTIKAIGVVGTGSALTGTALAVNEHEDDERDSEETPADDEETGAIRVGHFSPDAPNVDVYVDDQQILTDVAYNDLSPYLEIVPGTYTLTITAAGDDEPVYEETIVVDAEYYTAAAIGELEGEDDLGDDSANDDTDDVEAPETAVSIQEGNETDGLNETDDTTEMDDLEDDDPGTGTFEVLLLVDDGPEDIEEENTSRIRTVHASPDAPAVDIADGETGRSIFEDVGFTEPSGYVPVESGTRTLEIFPASEGDLGDDSADDTDDAEEPETAASIQEANETDDDGGFGDEDNGTDADDTDIIDQPDPVASIELELEEDTVYTGFAIGYLEELDGEELTVAEDDYANNGDDEFGDETDDESDDESDTDDRPFTVRVAIDGVMADEAEPDDDETGVEDDELEPEEGNESSGNGSATADDEYTESSGNESATADD